MSAAAAVLHRRRTLRARAPAVLQGLRVQERLRPTQELRAPREQRHLHALVLQPELLQLQPARRVRSGAARGDRYRCERDFWTELIFRDADTTRHSFATETLRSCVEVLMFTFN